MFFFQTLIPVIKDKCILDETFPSSLQITQPDILHALVVSFCTHFVGILL